MDLTLTIFVLVYVAMGVGHLPFFRLDRTGAALVGAMLLIALGLISAPDAWAAIDYRTIGLLFGLMVISAAFGVAGFYDFAAAKVGALSVGPKALLAVIIAVSGVLSALLTNDVVAVAMTPVFCQICLARRLNPLPFLLGFCFAANVGSSATLIGSPQNMIAAEALNLSFNGFLSIAALPSILGLPVVWLVLVAVYRGRWTLAEPQKATAPPPEAVDLDRAEAIKAGLVTLAVLVAFVATDRPHMLVALLGASFLLVSRSVDSEKLIRRVDGDLLLLLIGLFIVNAAVAATGLPQQLLAGLRDVGLDLNHPVAMLIVMSVLSNIVGNNPAVMLVEPFIRNAAHPEALGAAIALGTGFSSNAVIFGSLAGIIVAEQGGRRGIVVGFAEFARAGVPVALATLLLAAAWIVWLG
ncbi:MAG: transporter [Bosea sp.]|nr:transporter [Bosea sp. (in: a-proteobacteria)]